MHSIPYRILLDNAPKQVVAEATHVPSTQVPTLVTATSLCTKGDSAKQRQHESVSHVHRRQHIQTESNVAAITQRRPE